MLRFIMHGAKLCIVIPTESINCKALSLIMELKYYCMKNELGYYHMKKDCNIYKISSIFDFDQPCTFKSHIFLISDIHSFFIFS